MKLKRVQLCDDERSPGEYGRVHAAWDDGSGAYWLACGTALTLGSLMMDDREAVTCRKCLKLKLHHFRNVKRAIKKWLGW